MLFFLYFVCLFVTLSPKNVVIAEIPIDHAEYTRRNTFLATAAQ